MSEMKDSGIAWVGKIPGHWDIMPNKYVMYKTKDICAVYNNENILSLTMNGVVIRDLDAGGKMPSTFNGYQKLYPGNLLMCLFDYDVTPRCIGLIQNNGITSPAYSQFSMRHGNVARYYYYYYLMIDNDKSILHLAKNLRHSFTEDQLGTFETLVPPVSEQKQIADYLDKKCAEIDSVLKDIQKQIETLEQYKKSIISEATTKGLNPQAQMKDSGIRYIGTVPSHWRTKKGKFIFSYIQKSPKKDDGVITCFRDGEVTLRSKRREEGFTIAEKEIGYQGIDVGDLVVHGMDGFAGAIGISDSRGKASPVLNVLETNHNKRYYMYLLRTMAFRGVFESLSTGIRVRTCDTNWGKLREIFYNVPPNVEQKQIADYLDKKCAEIDSIIADKQAQLDIMEKYKKSLIYEYTTGKKEVVHE
jgi:type I restriction enzyme S subunit